VDARGVGVCGAGLATVSRSYAQTRWVCFLTQPLACRRQLGDKTPISFSTASRYHLGPTKGEDMRELTMQERRQAPSSFGRNINSTSSMRVDLLNPGRVYAGPPRH
jgi:hypothetical protein